MSKKSQVTIFIIIGMIMVVTVGLFIYFKIATAKRLDIIQPEAIPVYNFVESCINKIAKEGLATLGLNGGYIFFPESIERDPNSYLTLSPLGGMKNPYWWYDGISNIPTLDFMEHQISTYITVQLKDCLNNFEAFKDELDIEVQGNIITQTEITNNDIFVRVSYPIMVSSKLNETKTLLREFSIRTKTRLKKVYELAKTMMERENADAFLEEKTIDLIVLDNSIPTTDVEISCTKKKWYLPEIRNKLKTLLRVNLPYIRIVGTSYDDGIYVPSPFGETYKDSYFNYHYLWEISDEKFEDIYVSFIYDERWPLEMYARPSKDNVLTSNSQKGTDILSSFCLHTWHFTYDVSYPVKVAVKDETDNYEPFIFNFAFKVSIKNNQAERSSLAGSVREREERATSEEFCNDVDNYITIYTDDSITGNPISNVNLTFVCGVFDCDIGSSEWVSLGAAAALVKRLPYCVHGVVKGNKEGYEESSVFVQTDAERAFTLPMTPVKIIKKYNVVKHSSSTMLQKDLEENEKATIIIKRDGFETYGGYPESDKLPIKLLAKDDFDYELEIYLIKDEDIIGGYKGKWSVAWSELKDANEIVFHVTEQDPLPKDDTQRFMFINNLGEYSQDLPLHELK